MPKFVIIGSCECEPYTMLAMPNKLNPELYLSDHEKAYEEACKYFYPAIDNADFVLVYAPRGPHNLGLHTKRDVEYALIKGKRIVYVTT